jgi:hypothetical protein
LDLIRMLCIEAGIFGRNRIFALYFRFRRIFAGRGLIFQARHLAGTRPDKAPARVGAELDPISVSSSSARTAAHPCSDAFRYRSTASAAFRFAPPRPS